MDILLECKQCDSVVSDRWDSIRGYKWVIYCNIMVQAGVHLYDQVSNKSTLSGAVTLHTSNEGMPLKNHLDRKSVV